MKKKITSLFLCLMLLIGLVPVSAFAAENTGDFTVTGGTYGVDYTYDNGVLTITGGDITVQNTDPSTPTGDRIMVSGQTTLTIAGLNIQSTTGAPVEIDDTSATAVTLILENENTLISQCNKKAGLHKSRGQTGGSNTSTLVIKGDGTLTAQGKDAAGIGAGDYHGDVKGISIESGTINASGDGRWAAGIGASENGSVWDVVIKGGTINAYGKPGIGADAWNGVRDSSIEGGIVTANTYTGSTPTGGFVHLTESNTYHVYSDTTLSSDLTVSAGSTITIDENATLTMTPPAQLTNAGTMVNNGTITGTVTNTGTIYNSGSLPGQVGGTVHQAPYIEVIGGSGSGTYQDGESVTITADAPGKNQIFTGWTIQLGSLDGVDLTASTLTFPAPHTCLILQANYQDLVATLTAPDGSEQLFTNFFDATRAWMDKGGTLTLLKDIYGRFYEIPDNGVLDLGGYTLESLFFDIMDQKHLTIQNGTLKADRIYNNNGTIQLQNVTIISSYEDMPLTIENNGTIVNLGGLVLPENVRVNGNPIQCVGHTYSVIDCDEEGHTLFCSICQHEETQPHTEDEGTITVEPTYENDGVKTYTCTVCHQVLRTEVLPKLTYQITNGADLTYTIGSGKDVTITCDGALSDFTGVKIDGVTLPSSQYTVKEGSTIVTLPGDTLNTLAPGSHTITLVYQYGDVSTTLTVKAADTSDGGEEDKPDTKPDTNPDAKPDTPSDTTPGTTPDTTPDTKPDGNSDASDNTDSSTPNTVPETGSSSQAVWWLAATGLSAAGLGVLRRVAVKKGNV